MMFGGLLLGLAFYGWMGASHRLTTVLRLRRGSSSQTLHRRCEYRGGRKARSAKKRLNRAASLARWIEMNRQRIRGGGWSLRTDMPLPQRRWSIHAFVPKPWWVSLVLFGVLERADGRWVLTRSYGADAISRARSSHDRFPLAGVISLAQRRIDLVDTDDGQKHDVIRVPQRRGYLRPALESVRGEAA